MEVYAAKVPQASELGADLPIHEEWNIKSLPRNIIALKYYSAINEHLDLTHDTGLQEALDKISFSLDTYLV